MYRIGAGAAMGQSVSTDGRASNGGKRVWHSQYGLIS